MNSQKTLEELLKRAKGSFKPIAYYDKFMDTIRVEFRDCSSYEVRLDERFTVIIDNYPEVEEHALAGLVIKGIGHLFQRWGISKEGVMSVVSLINRILEEGLVDESLKDKIIPIQMAAATIEMRVDFRERKAAA